MAAISRLPVPQEGCCAVCTQTYLWCASKNDSFSSMGNYSEKFSAGWQETDSWFGYLDLNWDHWQTLRPMEMNPAWKLEFGSLWPWVALSCEWLQTLLTTTLHIGLILLQRELNDFIHRPIVNPVSDIPNGSAYIRHPCDVCLSAFLWEELLVTTGYNDNKVIHSYIEVVTTLITSLSRY